jgi:hypothetical protein
MGYGSLATIQILTIGLPFRQEYTRANSPMRVPVR